MWIDLITKKTYRNRLDVKLDIGSGQFNKQLKQGKIIYIDNQLRDNIKNN